MRQTRTGRIYAVDRRHWITLPSHDPVAGAIGYGLTLPTGKIMFGGEVVYVAEPLLGVILRCLRYRLCCTVGT